MTETLNALAARLLEIDPPTYELNLSFPGWAGVVHTNSAELRERLRIYFRDFPPGGEKPTGTIYALEIPEPDLGIEFSDWKREGGKTGRKDSFHDAPGGRALRKVRTGMQYVMTDDGVNLIFGACLKNANQVINFVNANALTAGLSAGGVLCHAAAVHGPRGGLAIAGFSGAGKSTLTMHLLDAGLTFVSNDRLIVREQGEGVVGLGVPKWPRINPGTLLTVPGLEGVLPADRAEALRALPQAELWDLEEKYDLFVAERYGPERVRLETPLLGLLVLDWTRGGDEPLSIDEVSLRDDERLLGAVEKSPGVFYVAPDGSRPTEPRIAPRGEYHALFDRLRVFRARGAVDFGAAVDHCRELLGA